MIVPYPLAMLALLLLAAAFIGAVAYTFRTSLKLLKAQLMLCAFLALCFIAALLYASWIEANTLNVTTTTLDLAGKGTPVRLVFISDIHAWTVSADFMDYAVRTANAQNPDVILLGGDYISWSNEEVEMLPILGNLSAKHGVYAVLGNHDYRIIDAGACPGADGNALGENVSAKLGAMGFTVLRNENVQLPGGVALVGVDDFWACKANYAEAMEGVDRSKPVILLTHNQEAIPPEEYPELNLALVGHTHCGQIRLPLIGSLPKLLVGFRGDYDAGLHQFDGDSYIYTTCGIGGGPRFLAPPEITVIDVS